MLLRRVKRTRSGEYAIRFPENERELIRTLPAQLRDLLVEETDDPSLRRLFPPAYSDDDERNEEYRRLMQEDLLAKRLAAVEVMQQTADATRLDEEQLTAWMGAINDLRLVLGTRLDVTEDMYELGMADDDPRAPAFALYSWLGWLQEQIVEALSQSLPDGEG